MDIPGATKTAKIFQKAAEGKPVILISAITRKGVDQLLGRIIQLLGEIVDEQQNRKL
jgi:50S ribosomal subunit-associated GTPase HflX